MIDNPISAEDRNELKSRLQLSYCKVRVTRESMALDNRRRNIDPDIIIGSEIYLILGGGVRYVMDKNKLNKNWVEMDWNELLKEIDKFFS